MFASATILPIVHHHRQHRVASSRTSTKTASSHGRRRNQLLVVTNNNNNSNSSGICGIDLGTTNSAVAIVTDSGKTEIVPIPTINNVETTRTMPSVIHFTSTGEVLTRTRCGSFFTHRPEKHVRFGEKAHRKEISESEGGYEIGVVRVLLRRRDKKEWA